MSTHVDPIVLPIWPDGAPGTLGKEEHDIPTIAAYLPDAGAATGAAVVVCPGGGYGHIAAGHEGDDFGQWFTSFGVAAFVVKYRIAPHYRYPSALQDACQAIRIVRSRSDEWRIDPGRIGVMGFSAGGHLASCVATIWSETDHSARQLADFSARPDFLILCYPVITLTGPLAHAGSRRNLLGDEPDQTLVTALSTNLRVTVQTPPTFLFHTDADRGVKSENSLLFYQALRNAGVPSEMHIYAKGPHGVGLAGGGGALSEWPDRLKSWIRELWL